MDYGGRKTLESGFVCNYAPILAIYTVRALCSSSDHRLS
jgi:hypothetical protein